MSILVLADHDNVIFKENNLKTIAAAKQIGSTIDVLVVGHNCDEIAKKASKVEHVNKVILCDRDKGPNNLNAKSPNIETKFRGKRDKKKNNKSTKSRACGYFRSFSYWSTTLSLIHI